jgi:thiamine pyrophosphate-dependent enzyme
MVHAAAGYARMRNGLGALACTTSIRPGATNMVTGAALATVNRLPVLLIPGDVFASRKPDPVLQQLEVHEVRTAAYRVDLLFGNDSDTSRETWSFVDAIDDALIHLNRLPQETKGDPQPATSLGPSGWHHFPVALAASALVELRHGKRSVGNEALKRLLRGC